MEQGQGCFAIFRANNPVAGQMQAHHQHPAHGGLVIHHQKGGPVLSLCRRLGWG
jgi:hypothetical protein